MSQSGANSDIGKCIGTLASSSIIVVTQRNVTAVKQAYSATRIKVIASSGVTHKRYKAIVVHTIGINGISLFSLQAAIEQPYRPS